jgi:hypothetical protein
VTERGRPADNRAANAEAGDDFKRGSTVTGDTDEAPQHQHRPWSGRPDAAQLEERFRRDRAGWRRRIHAARRLTHDARDELVAPDGRWTT